MKFFLLQLELKGLNKTFLKKIVSLDQLGTSARGDASSGSAGTPFYIKLEAACPEQSRRIESLREQIEINFQEKFNKSGFTLIEVVTTLALFIFIALITIPTINFYNSQLVKAELATLEMNINYLNSLSNLDKEKKILKFNIKDNSYNFENKTHKLNNNVKFGFLNNSFGPPSSPKKAIKEASTFKNDEIEFIINNYTSGTIYFCDKNKKYMFAISTGVAKKKFVRKYQYLNKKWITL